MKIVYLAHPISGNVRENINSILAIIRYINFKYAHVVPFAPYIPDCMALDDSDNWQRERGIMNDKALFIRGFIDELWLCGPVISKGMKSEMTTAIALNIPIVRHENIIKQTKETMFTGPIIQL